MRSHVSLGVASIAALLTVVAAGCGVSPPAPATPTGSPHLPLSGHSPPATARVGAHCGLLPARGAGSTDAMSGQRAVTAASGSPQLSAFSSAIRSASLGAELNRMRSLTLFVPDDIAFATLSPAQLSFLRSQANLVQTMREHVVPHAVTPAQIARGGTLVTLSGARLALARHGRTYRVGQATVLCGNIKTANGRLYVIDKVLLPPR